MQYDDLFSIMMVKPGNHNQIRGINLRQFCELFNLNAKVIGAVPTEILMKTFAYSE